jgi:pimeloyl-ACP methyl ester carboxylesterase
MSVIIHNQAIIHYEALGRGRPVVFLHGWIGSWRYWISSMQAASTSYRSYGLDLFGFGDTAHDPRLYSLEPQAELVTGFLDEMGIAKAALVGHGLGAWIALRAAARQPERVARVMAVSMPLDMTSINTRLRMANPAELVDWLSGRRAATLELVSDTSKMDPRVVAVSLRGFDAASLLPGFAATEVPGLLVYGQDDPLLHPPQANDALLLGPNVHRVDLEDSGHFPMLDATDRFNRLLTEFLVLEAGISPRELQLKEEWRRRVR